MKPKRIEPLSQERLKEEVTYVINLLIKDTELASLLAERQQAPDFTAEEGMMICVSGIAVEQALQDQINYIRDCGTSYEEFMSMFSLVRTEIALEAASPSKLAN